MTSKVEPWIDIGFGKKLRYDPELCTFDLSEMSLEVLCRALCNVPRFSGILRNGHNVGAHSYFVARQAEYTVLREGGAADAAKLAGRMGVLHDAHEIVLGDLATPFKRNFPLAFVAQYQYLAKQFDVAANKRFGLWDGLDIAFAAYTGTDYHYALKALKRSDDFAAKWEGQHMIPGGPCDDWASKWGDNMVVYPDFNERDFGYLMEGEIGWEDLYRTAIRLGLKP